MSLEVIYVIRHGKRPIWKTNFNTGEVTCDVKSPTGHAADVPLLEAGVKQAQELAPHLTKLSDAGPPITAVFSSPFYRCIQTIEPFVRSTASRAAAGSGLEPLRIRLDPGIGEGLYKTRFKAAKPATAAVLAPMFPDIIDETYEIQGPVPNEYGESEFEVHERAAAAAKNIIDLCDAQGHKAIVICSHAATIVALSRVLTGTMQYGLAGPDFPATMAGTNVFRRIRGETSENKAQGKEEKVNIPTTVQDAPNAPRSPGDVQHVLDVPMVIDSGVWGGWSCEVNGDVSYLSNDDHKPWYFGTGFAPSKKVPQGILKASV